MNHTNEHNFPFVYIIIPQWNNHEYTLKCIQSIYLAKYPYYKIVVIDDASNNNSYTLLLQKLKGIDSIRNNVNLGFAGSCNVGINKAIENSADYIFILNNDTIIEENCIDECVKVMQMNDTIGICQPKILFSHRRNHIDSTGQFVDLLMLHTERGKDEVDEGQYDQYKNIFACKGAAMFIRTKMIREIGYFDETYICNYEDIDLCWRAILSGYKITLVPMAIVYHSHHSPSMQQVKLISIYNSYKNQIRTMLKNYLLKNLILYVPIALVFCLFESLAYTMAGKRVYFKGYVKAFLWNLLHIKNTLEYRKSVQKLRKVKDIDIISQYICASKTHNINQISERLKPFKRKLNKLFYLNTQGK